MLTVFYAAKGGQGVTTLVAALAAIGDGPVVVDAAGDLLAALGLAELAGPGLAALLAGDDPIEADALVEAALATPGLPIVPSGEPLDGFEPQRWLDLANALAADRRHWLVDAGTGPAVAMVGAADRSLLVTRNCYLALRHATQLTTRPTGVVLVREPHRPLDDRDIERVVQAPVVATVEIDPRIARATDAGLVIGRVPNGLRRALGGLVPHPTGR
jgi:MinD-like ATPase involved in chromosome partitioning or flagellar assembly